ncbi:MAG: hypothetical protein WBG46_04520 [Nonlabens sp.]
MHRLNNFKHCKNEKNTFNSAVGYNGYHNSLSLVSCEDEIENTEQPAEQLVTTSEKESEQTKCEFEPYGLYFDNGLTRTCDNNMMYFPSWESFAQTLESLEEQADTHDDDFLNTYGHLDEDALNDIEDNIGHHPDQPLIDFENLHSFCSLRQYEEAAEDAWLDASDQPGWSMDDWVENDFLTDPVEQTLYNPQNEVMICKMIYKEMNGGWLVIDPTHPDATNALSAANEGNTFQEVVAQYGGSKEEQGAVAENFPTNPNSCFYKSKSNEKLWLDNTYAMRKANQFRDRTFDFTDSGTTKVFKAYTRNYKKKRGKLRRHRISSSARIYGDIYKKNIDASGIDNCLFEDDENEPGPYRKRRRSKAKLRIPYPSASEELGTLQDKLFSEHRQRPFYETLVFEN